MIRRVALKYISYSRIGERRCLLLDLAIDPGNTYPAIIVYRQRHHRHLAAFLLHLFITFPSSQPH